MQHNGKGSRSGSEHGSLQESGSTGHRAGAAQRPGLGAGGGSGDAPPSNTASHNCNPEYFQPLRWGTDSLYVSYAGELHSHIRDELEHLKKLAQSANPAEQAQAQLSLGEHVFEVRDKGAPLFPYVLEDGSFRVQLSRPSKALPMAYVKVSSGYLTHAKPADAEKALRTLLMELGELSGPAQVSRIDLFVDFASTENMESWDRHAWVTRASSINAYAVDGKFSGWMVGAGGILAARLYDKRLEIEVSRKHYLPGLWREAGWDGVLPVWRLEFEFKRETLVNRGLSGLDSVLANLNGLWSYATTEWLRLTLPSVGDQTRSRWPLHPLWGYLSGIDWETDGGPLRPRAMHARLPGDDKLFGLAFSAIVSFMAREGISDLERGIRTFVAKMDSHHAEKAHQLAKRYEAYVAERLAIKNREFNTRLNNPELEEERQALERKRQADTYRKASDGG